MRHTGSASTGVVALALLSASAVASGEEPKAGNPLVAALAACLTIREDPARLACTDRAARALVDAERAEELVVIDKARARSTRRSLFGIALGGADPITGRPDTERTRIEQLDTDIAGVRGEPNGRWLLTLSEGGRWRTTEPWDGGAVPRVGDKVLVKRAALGSYTLRIPGARLVRAMRVN